MVGAQPGPLLAHVISIWLGVIGPRALRLAGERADGWIPSLAYIPPSQGVQSNAIIDEATRAAGREPTVESGTSDDDRQIVGPPDHGITILMVIVESRRPRSCSCWNTALA